MEAISAEKFTLLRAFLKLCKKGLFYYLRTKESFMSKISQFSQAISTRVRISLVAGTIQHNGLIH